MNGNFHFTIPSVTLFTTLACACRIDSAVLRNVLLQSWECCCFAVSFPLVGKSPCPFGSCSHPRATHPAVGRAQWPRPHAGILHSIRFSNLDPEHQPGDPSSLRYPVVPQYLFVAVSGTSKFVGRIGWVFPQDLAYWGELDTPCFESSVDQLALRLFQTKIRGCLYLRPPDLTIPFSDAEFQAVSILRCRRSRNVHN